MSERLGDDYRIDTSAWHGRLRAATLALGLVALWALCRRFQGLAVDGEIYAAQAYARVHPNLANDLYLADTSQDSFTVFSPLYAKLIGWMGLPIAATVLFIFCTVMFLSAAWLFVRRLADERSAWLSVAVLICTVAPYGAYGIFEFSSNYLTARSLAEGLVVTSLAAFYGRRIWIAGIAVALAMFVHPLMALPGLLLLLAVNVRLRIAAGSCAIGIAALAILQQLAARNLIASSYLTVMDPQWLEVVRERSLFLFLRYWRLSDWLVQLRPYLCLGLTFACLPDPRVKKLCAAAAVIGLAGFMLAAVADTDAPLALLVQGQAWRWCWVASFIAVAMLAPTALQLWRDGGCASLSSVLVVSAWIFPPVDGTLLSALALSLWFMRNRVPPHRKRLLIYAAYLLLGIIGCWTIANFWLVTLNANDPTLIARVIDWLRGAFTLRPLGVALFGLLAFWVGDGRSRIWPELAAAGILACAVLPSATTPANDFAVIHNRDQVADWRAAIPETSTVLLIPAHKSAAVQWFTLERPSYLTVSQSAGVVFSAKTATEVRRRGENLGRLWPPDWKITSQIQAAIRGDAPQKDEIPVLTAALLQNICTDQQLGFVVAKETLGYGALHETHRGVWKNWNLYDCRKVRAASGGT